ncbi:hypothetical protein NEUTE1DRAFT_113887 [Neurospora tetrasperma FGSC 2508]|uniref:Uncharacterized protein n=1 Tax=Neurospora tetrasperma (strain FGSC 2508 / ATCC MYA-4615 / P0657) TaxID=510951 RepID=F8N4B2_NEUT8|nr:uncharacterized protein NEUTE1DRAFT_113887 [Neurospora tetrasperma FGSC 2508]EGO51855.1 hypothetical protein NEUTE1DRAFT_113887 [Neurospora tetrasperma FGSC 2508]
MCYTYRILESMDPNIHLSMFSPELEKCTSRPEVQVPSVYCLRPTSSETTDIIGDSDDDSYHEYFDALTGDEYDSPINIMEDVEDLPPNGDDWSQDAWPQDDWAQNDIDTYNEEDNSQTEANNTSEDSGHPLAGWHSHRLANSDWTHHSFVDKTDHIDMWVRHSERTYSLARCNWVVFPEDGWSKPEYYSAWGAPEAPELKLVTPEGDVCWLDDSVDYEALPWEREVAEERNRMLAAIW